MGQNFRNIERMAISMSKIVCIVCPAGCVLEAENTDGEIKVTGCSCKRGVKFAIDEITNPMRTICSFVKTVFDGVPVLPVRVSCDIPKGKIFDVMAKIKEVNLSERVGRGEVIIKNVLGLEADIISTSNMLKEKI